MKVTLFILLLAFSHCAFSQSYVAKHGALSVKNGVIVNSKGLPPQLRGISLSWSIWQGQKYYNTRVVDWLCKDFKISLLRASMAIQPEGGYLQNPEKQLKIVTPVIDHAIKNGIYVLIDWHDHNAEKHVKEAKEFFGIMAKKYAHKPNVIYEIWNEPERQSWDVIKKYSIEVINEIRKHDSINLIIVGSPHWDQDVDVAAKDPITGYSNIAYSFHFYATEPSHQDGLRKKAETAMKKGLPLFVTEWGVGEANGDGKFHTDKTDKWLKWMETHKLSWANWNITDKKETTALLLPGSSKDGSWKVTELTPAGKYIRNVLRKLNK